ncbi:MAG TPA: DUF2336 domain-containing protein [Beijerinckiaceae bacterium]
MTTRPAILRALTDLFVLRPTHSDDDVRRFEELALRIVADADPATLAYVAAKLARHAAAPPTVLARLAEADRACALIVIEHAVNLPMEDQIAVAVGPDPDYASALARRRHLSGVVTEALLARGDAVVSETLAHNPTAQFNRSGLERAMRSASTSRESVEAMRARSVEPTVDKSAFLSVDAGERGRLIAEGQRAAFGRRAERHEEARRPHGEAVLGPVVEAAQAGDWDEIARVLGDSVGWSAEDTLPLVEDPGGEPLALLLAAAGCDADEAVRVFLCGPPSVSHSYARVRKLSVLVRETDADSARRMLSEFVGRDAHAPARRATTPAVAERMRHAEGARSFGGEARRAPAARERGKTTLLMRRSGFAG